MMTGLVRCFILFCIKQFLKYFLTFFDVSPVNKRNRFNDGHRRSVKLVRDHLFYFSHTTFSTTAIKSLLLDESTCFTHFTLIPVQLGIHRLFVEMLITMANI